MRTLFFSLPLLFVATVHPMDSHQKIENCLLECYRLDRSTSDLILEKFAPVLENSDLIDSFLEESEKLEIYSGGPTDKTSASAPHHSILFENNSLRISWAVTKSGEQEPSQQHPWKTLMVILQPSQFHSERSDGVFYEDDWPIGTYVLEPSLDFLSCKNIGTNEYQGLIFEIKTEK